MKTQTCLLRPSFRGGIQGKVKSPAKSPETPGWCTVKGLNGRGKSVHVGIFKMLLKSNVMKGFCSIVHRPICYIIGLMFVMTVIIDR